jgi:hypothetical protein
MHPPKRCTQSVQRRRAKHVRNSRNSYPEAPFPEATVIAGGRAGKDGRLADPTVLFEPFFGVHDGHLAKGERGVVPLVAQDQRATAIILAAAGAGWLLFGDAVPCHMTGKPDLRVRSSPRLRGGRERTGLLASAA